MFEHQVPASAPSTDAGSPGFPRRSLLRGGAVLLASVGAAAVQRGMPATAGAPAAQPVADLARFRPVRVSSTAYGPAPAEFAVDGLAVSGVRGSGWRAASADDGQWLAVDLQARCRISSVRVVFETTQGDDVFVPADDINPRNGTTGWEVLSSYATSFRIEVSDDGSSWRAAHSGRTDVGGIIEIPLTAPVTARWVRFVGLALSGALPLGINGFEVFGTTPGRRPAVVGWTEWTSGSEPVRPLRLAADGTVPIEDGWNLTTAEFAGTADGSRISTPDVDTSRWLRAEVPGTILASLVARGHLPDPVGGFENLHVPEALGRQSWWYRRTLRLPHRFPARGHDRLRLEFDGINHHAEIWIDGVRIGEMSHPFARASFDVTDVLDADVEHTLAVRIDPMPFPGSPGDKGEDGVPYADAGSGVMMRNAPTYLAVSGWDWMPAVRDRVMGIWNHVRLRSTGAAVIGDPVVNTHLIGDGRSTAEVTVVVPVRAAGGSPVRTTVRVSLAGVELDREVEAGPDGIDVEFTPAEFSTLRIHDPKLWWPNGYGEPTLHDLRVELTVDGRPADQRALRVGLREFGYESENPLVFPPGANRVTQTVELEPVSTRRLRVRALSRATGFGVSLWTLSAFGSAAPDTDLARGAAATASSQDNASDPPSNAVDGDPETRWSSAYSDDQWIAVDLGSTQQVDRLVLTWETAYASRFVVETSDDGVTWVQVEDVDNRPRQLRILVNGVPVLCRGGNWGWDELLRRMGDGRMEAVVAMHRDMNFTMIRNWLGSSDREEFFARCDENGLLVWNDFPNAWFLDPPDHPLYLAQARDTVRRYRSHPSIVVWCGANEGTPSAEIDQGAREIVAAEHPGVTYVSNSAGGIVSGGGPYAWIDPKQYWSPETFGAKTFGFHTEIGIPTVSVVESMQNLAGDADAWPIGTVWKHHDWATRGNQYPQSYQGAIDERFGASSSLVEFSERAQFVNFESMRSMFEAWNAHLWEDATGLLLWMSNPAWHSTVWQTYDYDLDVNGSYYGSRAGCEPLHVQADPRTGEVLALNHTAAALPGATVVAEVLDLGGRTLERARTQRVDLPAAARTSVFTVAQPAKAPPLHLLRLRLLDRSGAVRSENTYWRSKDAGALATLDAATGARLQITAVRTVGRGDAKRFSATVRNSGTSAAPMVRLSVLDDRSGERVLPTLWSENFFWLLPKESRDVTVSWPAGTRPPSRLRLRAQGYRVAPVSRTL